MKEILRFLIRNRHYIAIGLRKIADLIEQIPVPCKRSW